MSRLRRLTPAGIPLHLIQRGNNRQVCFGADEDYVAYGEWLKEYSRKYDVSIHAWVWMTNHTHLLCTPNQEGAISRMMQALGRRYVRYFNHKYRRTGTLWEGRYKSCVIDAEHYLLAVYRYIELNPVREEMVIAPGEYKWSSYQANALGKSSGLCTPHSEYLALGETHEGQLKNYRLLFSQDVGEKLLKDISSNTNKGMAIGNGRFKSEIEELTGRRLHVGKSGRPKGWRRGGEKNMRNNFTLTPVFLEAVTAVAYRLAHLQP